METKKMINFTVGPVESPQEVLKAAEKSAPYFRTPEFSEVMLNIERTMLEMLHAPAGSRCVILTTSGTGAMESVVSNVLSPEDKVLVINGGTFGERFAQLCRIYRYSHEEIRLNFGESLLPGHLEKFENQGFTALLVNMDETSSGVLYDMELISDFCRRNHMLLIIDAISAFLADPLDMTHLDADVVLTCSQKALALHPGISIIAMNQRALKRVEKNEEHCLYLSLKEALKNGERGQTPFTPAVTTILELDARLKAIQESGGLEHEQQRIAALAQDFRKRIQEFPFERVTEETSNAVTALYAPKNNAQDIVRILKDDHSIWACPNGGEIGTSVFRIGHIGNLTLEDNDSLFAALEKMKEKGQL